VSTSAVTNASNSSCELSPTHVSHTPRTERDRRQRRIRASIRHLEQHREAFMRNSKLAGKTTESNVAAVNYHINLRRVNFKWQRGIKIGRCRVCSLLRCACVSFSRKKYLVGGNFNSTVTAVQGIIYPSHRGGVHPLKHF